MNKITEIIILLCSITLIFFSIFFPVIYVKKRKVKSNYKSKGEKYTCEALHDILKSEVINNIRMDELKNPNTGKNLEIDCWCPEYRIGVEYDGITHRQYTPHFHSSYDKFLKQKENDNIKNILCEKNNINLIRIADTVDMYHYVNNEYKVDKKATDEIRYKRIYNYLKLQLNLISSI